MQSSAPARNLPNPERLSVLAATLLLAYTLTRFVDLTGWVLTAHPLGILISIQINVQTIIPILVAGIMAAGASWLLSDHPALQGTDRHAPGPEHWLLPAVVAWVIGIPLSQSATGYQWVLGLFIAGGLLALILTAEYIAIDPEDLRQPVAEAGLTAVSFAAYLVLAIALRAAETRLYLILPSLALTAGVVSLRTWHLRLGGEWALIEAGLVVVIIGQIAAALHYWPLSPLSYGLAILGPAYAMTTLVSNMADGATFRQALPGPLDTGIWLPAALREAMQRDVHARLPNEACGLVGGLHRRALEIFPVTNDLHSPVRFRMDSKEQVRVLLDLEQRGWDLLAIYHSHPNGPDQPSPTDLSEAAYPEAVNLIWSGETGEWRCRGFLILGSQFYEIPIWLVNE
jgi:proteasome lid subunit RPN8/RPN11